MEPAIRAPRPAGLPQRQRASRLSSARWYSTREANVAIGRSGAWDAGILLNLAHLGLVEKRTEFASTGVVWRYSWRGIEQTDA